MRATRDLIRAQVDNPAFSAEDVAFLDVLVARFDELDEDWDRLARACTGLPPTLIHGDFNGKNLRMQASPQGLQVGAFDWEDAGWAVPGVDLAQAVDPSCHISASPDLATYWAVVRERWPNCDQTDIERLATCGAVWRALAAITWEAHHLHRTGGARPVRAPADLRRLDEPCGSLARARRCHRESLSGDGGAARQGDRRAHPRGGRGARARHLRRFATRPVGPAAEPRTARR